MSALRFIWNHPGVSALLSVAAVMLFPLISAHPLASSAIAIVVALSAWASVREGRRRAALEQQVIEAAIEVDRRHYEAVRAAAAPYVEAADKVAER